MKYSIVVPTYNHCDDLLKPCLESIFKYTDMADVELLISANGCKDNTEEYLDSLIKQFESIGFEDNIKVIWSENPIGYPKANNVAIAQSRGKKIILLNNDIVLLNQNKNHWLDLLEKPFRTEPHCGISCIVSNYSREINRNFAVFFCVMIDRKVFEKIGLLDESFGVGSGEDIDFCIRTENAGFTVDECLVKEWGTEVWTGGFPIWHKGEGTVHDSSLVHDWNYTFDSNKLKLVKKYNPEKYKYLLSNNYERAVFLNGDDVFSREKTRYKWAAENLLGTKVLEIGCSTGYGIQFLPEDINYTGLDYDRTIIDIAKEQNWRSNINFVNADINKYEFEKYDTIIAFEIIEHIKNGLEVVQEFKKHTRRLLLTVPYKEEPGFWGEHHVLHNLDESHFPGFTYRFIDENGNLLDSPNPNTFNLMMCKYDAE